MQRFSPYLKKVQSKLVASCKGEFISSLFLLPKKSGSFRPVINLKPLNIKSIHTAIEILNYGDYMVSLDLKDAYLSVPIFSPYRKYLLLLNPLLCVINT